jgi:hypothetical protein
VALTPPLFLQEGVYSARVTRQLMSLIGTEGVVSGLTVVQRSAGANMSVDVAAGKAIVEGDDQANQYLYLSVNEGTVNLPVQGADPTNPRIDRVVLEIRDTNAGGPAGDDASLRVIEGTPAGSPTAPALPDSAISLALIDVAAAATSILDANITDTQAFAQGILPTPREVGTTAVGANYTLVLGDAFKVIEYTSASNYTVTIPPNSSVSFPVGTVVNVYRGSTGTVAVTAGSGVTVRNAGSIAYQFGEVSLRKRDTDEWVLSGQVV